MLSTTCCYTHITHLNLKVKEKMNVGILGTDFGTTHAEIYSKNTYLFLFSFYFIINLKFSRKVCL